MTTDPSPCPVCGSSGCAAPVAGAAPVSPDLLVRLRVALAGTPPRGLPVATIVPTAHPLRVLWTTAADAPPPGTIFVGYGRAQWGNPFDVREFGHDGAVARYREWLLARPRLVARARRELAGRRLACWCSLSVACHADVLLRLADPAGRWAPQAGPAPSVARSAP